MRLKLTKKGQELLAKTLNNEDAIDFYLIKLGEGVWTEDEIVEAESIKEHFLDAEIQNATTSTNDDGDKFIDLFFMFNNSDTEAGHRITEIGVFAKNKAGDSILYAIGYEDELTADYVPSVEERPLEFELQISVYIGDSEKVTATINEFLAAATKLDIKNHVDDKNNPHKVTKNQVGLGNVPNVKTEDQTPEFSEAAELSNINSREKLSVIMGKIKKAIASLINHINNKENPHELTADQIKAAGEKHSHSAQEIKMGILSVPRGGSGKGEFDEKAVILGNGKEAFDSVKGTGAFFSYGDAEGPKFDTLPVQFGGTGIKKGAEFSNEGSYGCFGSVVLPGNLLVQWGRLNCDDRKVTVDFLKNFASDRYALIFTTSSGDVDAAINEIPEWRVPKKNKDSFIMARDWKAGVHVADWVAFGEAEVTE